MYLQNGPKLPCTLVIETRITYVRITSIGTLVLPLHSFSWDNNNSMGWVIVQSMSKLNKKTISCKITLHYAILSNSTRHSSTHNLTKLLPLNHNSGFSAWSISIKRFLLLKKKPQNLKRDS